MADATTTIAELRELFAQFVAERDWAQFHSPKNLAMGLSVEAAELMEHFLWIDNETSRRVTEDPQKLSDISDEIADVAMYLLAFSNTLGLDLSTAIRHKLEKTKRKYPVEKIRGRFRLEPEE